MTLEHKVGDEVIKVTFGFSAVTSTPRFTVNAETIGREGETRAWQRLAEQKYASQVLEGKAAIDAINEHLQAAIKYTHVLDDIKNY
jgi:hypothetical protein